MSGRPFLHSRHSFGEVDANRILPWRLFWGTGGIGVRHPQCRDRGLVATNGAGLTGAPDSCLDKAWCRR